MTRALSCTAFLMLVVLVDAKPDRTHPEKQMPAPPTKLNLSGDWKSSCGYFYTIAHEGIAIEFRTTDGQQTAAGAVNGKTINVVWYGEGQTWRYIGRYQWIDGKLIGVWGRSNCLHWDDLGTPQGEYTRDVLTLVSR